MKVNAYKNNLRDNSLAAKLMTSMSGLTRNFDFVLPRGWRFIAEIATNTDNGTPQQLFYLDLQATEGGGSWAEAKIQTMKQMNLPATQPLSAGRIRNWVLDAGVQNTEYGKEVCSVCNAVYSDPNYQSRDISDDILNTDQLSKETVRWLVDVKNGPGVAPNFGGLSLSTKCHFFKDDDSAKLGIKSPQPVTETDTIYVAFSGAKAWQDLQFATCALKHIIKHLDDIPDESFEPDFEPLKKIPEVHLWLANYGLV